MAFTEECNRLSLFCRAFSNKLRLGIICTLRDGELSVNDISTQVNESKHNVSQQLKYLRLTGTLAARKDGRNIYYRLDNPDMIDLLESLMEDLGDKKFADWLERVG